MMLVEYKKKDIHLQNRIAIRVPSNRATPNPNAWSAWYKLNPSLLGPPGTPVTPVALVVEGGRTTVWESVLILVTVVAGTAVVEITTGVPGGVTVVRVVGVTTGEVTTGRVTTGGPVVVGPRGMTLTVTGARPNPLHTPWNVSTRFWAVAMVSLEGLPVRAQLTQFCKPAWTVGTQRHAAVVHLSKADWNVAHAESHAPPCRAFKN